MEGGVKEADLFLGWERLRHNYGQTGMIRQRGWEGGRERSEVLEEPKHPEHKWSQSWGCPPRMEDREEGVGEGEFGGGGMKESSSHDFCFLREA